MLRPYMQPTIIDEKQGRRLYIFENFFGNFPVVCP